MMIKSIGVFLYTLIFINSLSVIIIVLLERKRPEKTIAWLLVIILLPPIGLILYIFLGRDWKFHRLNKDFSPKIKELIGKVINKVDNPDYIPLIELLGQNSESPLFIYNDITILKDGVEKFESLKEEIKNAKHHIHLEYYIVKNDKIGNEIKDLLIKKSHEGIKVRFIIDRVGSIKLGRKYINEMITAGIDVVQYSYFLAPLVKKINTQINYRNHRKIIIIDGKVGYIGGINIGDEYLGKSKLGYWRDTHLMIKGDFVLGLQGVFMDDFLTIKKANNDQIILNEADFFSCFPKIEKCACRMMQLIKSGPDSPYPSIMQATLKMITTAKESIYITTPYFVPPESIMDALKIALLSGVDVRILFPGRYDHFTVYYASKTYLAELIRCGAKVYLYNPESFIHSKVMTVDGKISTVGTANMDIRSYELNYEINALIYDEDVTCELNNLFLKDLEASIMLTEKDYNSTPFFTKSLEAIARLFSAIL